MNCFKCAQEKPVGGWYWKVSKAVGICHHCGIGICLEHSAKPKEPGLPLMCLDCAALDEVAREKPRTAVRI